MRLDNLARGDDVHFEVNFEIGRSSIDGIDEQAEFTIWTLESAWNVLPGKMSIVL